MNLVFIYGPPASGKTTIGRILAHKTKYDFFYNHATTSAARAIFPDRHNPLYAEKYSDLLKELRLAGITAAVNANLSIIFTLAYSGDVDNNFVAKITRNVTKGGGKTHFVQLHAPDTTLSQRVNDPTRRRLGKVINPTHLATLLASRDLRAHVPYDDILHIDTSTCTPEQSAQTIIDQFHLLPQKPTSSD